MCQQVFILGVPPNVAAVWFGAEQVSSACSIGVFGNQVRYNKHESLWIVYTIIHLDGQFGHIRNTWTSEQQVWNFLENLN
jgi:hypothetical protein